MVWKLIGMCTKASTTSGVVRWCRCWRKLFSNSLLTATTKTALSNTTLGEFGRV